MDNKPLKLNKPEAPAPVSEWPMIIQTASGEFLQVDEANQLPVGEVFTIIIAKVNSIPAMELFNTGYNKAQETVSELE